MLSVILITPFEAASQAPEPEQESATYRVEFVGLDETPDLAATIEDVSSLLLKQEEPPRASAALVRRVDRDLALFRDVARSQGYYGAVFESMITEAADDAVRHDVTIGAAPGAIYRISSVSIEPTGSPAPANLSVPPTVSALPSEIQPAAACRDG